MASNVSINKFDGYTLVGLMTNLVATTAVLFIPNYVALIARQDGWIAPLIAILSGIVVIFITYRLAQLYPDKTLIEYLPLLLGNIIGKIVGFCYLLYFTYIAATVIREFISLLFGTGIFKLTPGIIVSIIFVMTTTYALYSGLEVIGRTTMIFWAPIIIAYVLFIVLAIPHMKFSVLFPVGQSGFANIMKSTILTHTYRGEFIILAMLFPHLRSQREGFIAAIIANLSITFFIVITIIACFTVMGVETTARSLYPNFVLADFIQPVGIKVVLVIIWVISFWGKVSLLQYSVTEGLSQLLGLKNHKPIIMPIAILILVFSQVFYLNTTDLFESIPNTFPGIALFFSYIIPILLLIIAMVKIKVRPPINSASKPSIC